MLKRLVKSAIIFEFISSERSISIGLAYILYYSKKYFSRKKGSIEIFHNLTKIKLSILVLRAVARLIALTTHVIWIIKE